MAAIALHDGVVKLDDAGGTPRDISSTTLGVTINVEKNVGGHHTIGNDWEAQTEGGKRWTADLEVIESTGSNEGHELLRAWMISGTGSRTLTVDSPDSSNGSLRFTGEVTLSGISPITQKTGGSGDVARARASLVGNGALSASVIV